MVQNSVSSETTTWLDDCLNPPSHPSKSVVGCAVVVAAAIPDAMVLPIDVSADRRFNCLYTTV